MIRLHGSHVPVSHFKWPCIQHVYTVGLCRSICICITQMMYSIPAGVLWHSQTSAYVCMSIEHQHKQQAHYTFTTCMHAYVCNIMLNASVLDVCHRITVLCLLSLKSLARFGVSSKHFHTGNYSLFIWISWIFGWLTHTDTHICRMCAYALHPLISMDEWNFI